MYENIESGGRFQGPMYDVAFSDATHRVSQRTENVVDYTEDPELGNGVNVTLLVKWTNQLYHDENLRSMNTESWDSLRGISKVNIGRHRNQYYPGLVLDVNLSQTHLNLEGADSVEPMIQPTGMAAISEDAVVYAAANRLIIRKHTKTGCAERIIENPMFARLHDVDVNAERTRIITVSSSLDMVYEIDFSGNIAWELDLWGINNVNKLGQKFSRSQRAGETSLPENPDVEDLRDDLNFRGVHCVISDPSKYQSLGLPTNLIPTFVNSVAYGNGSNVLMTTFHSGEAWLYDRDQKNVTVVAKDMKHPHGLRTDPLLGGYIVSDTVREKTIYLSGDCREELAIDHTGLAGHKPGQEAIGWLQQTSRIGDSLYCSILSSRQQLILFDPVQKLRRAISLDPNWGVQLVTNRSL